MIVMNFVGCERSRTWPVFILYEYLPAGTEENHRPIQDGQLLGQDSNSGPP